MDRGDRLRKKLIQSVYNGDMKAGINGASRTGSPVSLQTELD